MYVEYIIKRRSVNPYPTKEEKMNQPPVTKPSSKDTQTQFYIPKSAYYEMSRLQAHKDRQLVRKDIDKWVYESAGRTGNPLPKLHSVYFHYIVSLLFHLFSLH